MISIFRECCIIMCIVSLYQCEFLYLYDEISQINLYRHFKRFLSAHFPLGSSAVCCGVHVPGGRGRGDQ